MKNKLEIGDRVSVLNGFRKALPKDVQRKYDIILFNKLHNIEGKLKLKQTKEGNKYVYLVNGVFVPAEYLEVHNV